MAERPFGPYTLVRQIAVGGMAEIHLAKTSGIAGFEKYVALKMIHPNFSEDQSFSEMLIDEAKITVQLQHVNIAQTFDLGRVGDTYYITMEYVDGADLYKLLRRGSERDKDVPVPVAAHVAKEIATGLDYAHRKRDSAGRSLGIVHRDVSPQNVLLSYAGEVKLVDFGIAKATMRVRQTAVGVIKGKYYYMSPEQAWGDPLDHRTDIFSCGILLYEMLTGQMLYLEEDLHKLLDMVRKAQIAPPSTLSKDVPPQLERIVMHSLSKKPEDRYQTAADFATDLERFLHAYAPVFTGNKVAGWVADVLKEDEAPPVVPPPAPPPVPVRRETKRLTREQIVIARSEITDENSVIYNVADLKPPRDIDDHTQLEESSESSGPRAIEEITARPASPLPARPAPPRAVDKITERPANLLPRPRSPDKQTAKAPAASLPASKAPAAGSAAPLAPLPASGRARTPSRGVPRGVDDHTQQIEDPALRETVLAEEASLEMDDATVVSAPKFTVVPHTKDREIVLDTTLVDAEISAEESDLSADITDTEPAHDPFDHDPTLSRDSMEHDATSVAVRSGGTDNRDAGWEKAPALAASNPVPALSAIRTPKRSRRTPPNGAPTGSGSALSSLLDARRTTPHVSMSSRETAETVTAEIQAGAFPPPSAPKISFLPLAPPAQPTPEAFPTEATGGFPPNTASQLAALEVDEIPERFKIANKRSALLIWGGLALLGVLVVVTYLAFSFGGETSAVQPASIEIVSRPEGATVLIDGEKLPSRTPTLFSGAKPGKSYLIVVDLPGYQRWESEERIPDHGGNRAVMAQLDKIIVSLSVSSEPPGASVYLDGVPMGRTPVTLNKLDPATATTLELRKKGFRPVRRKLDWTVDTEKELRLLLDR